MLDPQPRSSPVVSPFSDLLDQPSMGPAYNYPCDVCPLLFQPRRRNRYYCSSPSHQMMTNFSTRNPNSYRRNPPKRLADHFPFRQVLIQCDESESEQDNCKSAARVPQYCCPRSSRIWPASCRLCRHSTLHRNTTASQVPTRMRQAQQSMSELTSR